jgi:hypothetical protein
MMGAPAVSTSAIVVTGSRAWLRPRSAVRLTDGGPSADVRRGWIGDDEVQVLIGSAQGEDPQPVAIFVTDWIREHLYLYSRELWHRRR